MGGWDRWGYSDLIPGSAPWWLNQSAIEAAIASPEHFTDYAEYGGQQDPSAIIPDLSSLNPSGAHPDNSMADFMLGGTGKIQRPSRRFNKERSQP